MQLLRREQLFRTNTHDALLPYEKLIRILCFTFPRFILAIMFLYPTLKVSRLVSLYKPDHLLFGEQGVLPRKAPRTFFSTLRPGTSACRWQERPGCQGTMRSTSYVVTRNPDALYMVHRPSKFHDPTRSTQGIRNVLSTL